MRDKSFFIGVIMSSVVGIALIVRAFSYPTTPLITATIIYFLVMGIVISNIKRK